MINCRKYKIINHTIFIKYWGRKDEWFINDWTSYDVLGGAYIIYGRWLANTWGIDPKAKTPAYTKEDGEDFIPTPKGVVFSHQFSSIAGAGPVTGPILAAVFGWVPVLLWILIGGIFFGAVHDFGALYASVKMKENP